MKDAVHSSWSGRKVLITAGPTRESLDPIRYLTNASSGMMGFSLARVARDLGAKVTVVSGPCEFAAPKGINVLPVITAEQMHRKVLSQCRKADVVIAAAAVGDWKFKTVSAKKIKRTDRPLRVTLMPNPDIIADVSRLLHSSNGRHPHPVLVGFALETDHWLANAKKKMRGKGLDVIVANKPDSLGFDRARVAVLDRRGAVSQLPAMSKLRVAQEILRCVEAFF